MNKRASANVYIIISIALGYILSLVVLSLYPDGIRSAEVVNVLNITNVIVITLIPTLIFAIADRKTFTGMFKKTPAENRIKYLAVVPVLWCSATYLNSRMNIFLEKLGMDMIEQLPETNEAGAILAGFILTCVIAPLLEEIFYRGVILSLLKGYGNGAAIVVSAVLFAVAHGSVTVFVSPLVFGLALGYIVIRSGSIFPAIFIHFGCNLLSWFLMTAELGQKANIVINLTTITLGAATSVWAVVKILKQKEKAAKTAQQVWGYVKNPLWLPIIANYIYINIINHG